MKIAIIIGVYEYLNPNNNLPGSKNDAILVHDTLRLTGKFNDILYINNGETSSRTKQLLTSFISKYLVKEVDELLFYYTGHGEFLKEEFYYILSDFDPNKRFQTSLQNSEIDNLIRTLSPNLVIKIVDACQSGTTYIKDANILNKYFQESKNQFKNCYFLNSSLSNQSSYQNEHISIFTYYFIKALVDCNSDEIRYKDIIDVILDGFKDIPEQTPFFVIQANFTEIFCHFTPALRQFLSKFEDNHKTSKNTVTRLTLSDIIKKDATNYVDKEGVKNTLMQLGEYFKKVALCDDIIELFDIDVVLLNSHVSIPQKHVIANWLSNQTNVYFAKAKFEEVFDEDEFGNPYMDYELTEFDLNIETTFKAVRIEVLGKFPNISSYRSDTIFIFSRTNIRFFYYISNYVVEGWDKMRLNTNDLKWVSEEYKLSNFTEITQGINGIYNFIQTRILSDLKEKFRNELLPES